MNTTEKVNKSAYLKCLLDIKYHQTPLRKCNTSSLAFGNSADKACKDKGAANLSKNFRPMSRTFSEEKTRNRKHGLDWRDVVIEAEELVGYPTPYLALRSFFDDDLAKSALQLRKLICSNHPLLKSTKNVLFGSKYSLQSLGLTVLLMSKAAGFNTERFSQEGRISGILNSQRVLSETIEMARNSHLINNVLNKHKIKDKHNSVIQDFLCGNYIGLLPADFSTIILKKYIANPDVVKLITKGLEDLVRSENLAPRNKRDDPMASRPKGEKEIERCFWEHADRLKNIELENFENFVGRGKDEWIYRTMLSSGSILGKACQGAMMLAERNDLERDAYLLGSHLAVLWQLHLDLKDFFIHPHSFSYVGAPVTIALWEYPTIYSLFVESRLEKTDVAHKQLYYAVRGTRAMEYITSFLENEIATVLEYSYKLPVEDARLVLQKMAVSVYKEAIEYIE